MRDPKVHVRIVDTDAIRSIPPDRLQALAARWGWVKGEEVRWAHEWEAPQSVIDADIRMQWWAPPRQLRSVLICVRMDLGDYLDRTGEVVRALAAAHYDGDELALWRELWS